MVTGGTKLHDQKDTNLCAYFATMSALRHQLKKAVGNEISGIDSSKIDLDDQDYRLVGYDEKLKYQVKRAKEYEGLKIEEYLERRDQDEIRFERDLTLMIGCVCPRALSVRFKIRELASARPPLLAPADRTMHSRAQKYTNLLPSNFHNRPT